MIWIEVIQIMDVIDSGDLERDAGGKPVSTFPHPAPVYRSCKAVPEPVAMALFRGRVSALVPREMRARSSAG